MDVRRESDPAHMELGDLCSVDFNGFNADDRNAAALDDQMFLECVVCQYWSDRVDEAWRQRQDDLAKAQLQRLLKEHQKRGACARRLPEIFTDLKRPSTRLY